MSKGVQRVGGRSKAQRATDRLSGEPGQTGGVGALLKTTLSELLAIGMVGLATYLLVSLILWLVSLLS